VEEEKTEVIKVGDKSKPKKGSEKVEISEKDSSVPAKNLTVSNGKPKETIVIKNEPQKPANLKEVVHLNKNEKSKEPNVIQGSIQLNPKSSPQETKHVQQKPTVEAKNTKNIQEPQPNKGKSSQSETIASPKQETTKANASNQKPASSEIKLNEVVDKAKVVADNKLKTKPSNKQEVVNSTKVEEQKKYKKAFSLLNCLVKI